MHVAKRWTQTQDGEFLQAMADWAADRRVVCLEAGRLDEAEQYGRLTRMARTAWAENAADPLPVA